MERICSLCGKISYSARASAEWLARHSAGVRLRVYRCPDGRGWHLTSRRPRRKPALRTRPPRGGRRTSTRPSANR
jgi:hypothetical protein